MTLWPLHPLLITISFHYWLLHSISLHFQPRPAISVHFHSFSGIFGHFWLPVTPSDHFAHFQRPFLVTTDYFWPLQSISSHFQPHPDISGHIRPFSATCDPSWPLPTTSTHFWWPLLTTNDHFWPFKGRKSRGKTFGRWLLYTAYIVHGQPVGDPAHSPEHC